jgi:hypothetical protein
MGLPGSQAIGWLLSQVFGDPDEPKDPELMARNMIGDPTLADLLLKGVPAMLGVDMSSRLGAANILSPTPYQAFPTDRKSYGETLMGLSGPFLGGVMPKMFDGIGYIGQGDYMKATESMMPNGFANAVKGYRLATQGMTMKNGDLVMKPDEIGFLDAFAQAVGLPTSTITDRAWRSGVKFESDQFYNARTHDLKREYTRAYNEGDSSKLSDVRDQWTHMQNARKDAGYKPAPLSELLKSPRDQAKREKATIGGVQGRGKKDMGALRHLEEIS